MVVDPGVYGQQHASRQPLDIMTHPVYPNKLALHHAMTQELPLDSIRSASASLFAYMKRASES